VRERLFARLSGFDFRGDQALESHRSNRAAVFVFSWASRIANHSVLWHSIGLFYGLVIDRDWRATVLFSSLIGAESLVVNQGIKRIFRRTRPIDTGDPRFKVRKAQSSSFPSGHASSAFFASTLLTVWIAVWLLPLFLVLAVTVAASRAFVRIHHPSDVVAGAITGLVLAGIAVLTPALDAFTN
jgi:undecaprenyl-diphosphatase